MFADVLKMFFDSGIKESFTLFSTKVNVLYTNVEQESNVIVR